jgi:hypothetical protein
MLKLVTISTVWASLIVGTTFVMCAMGYGEPNLCEGETLIGFYSFLYFLCWITVPMAGLMLALTGTIFNYFNKQAY